MPERNLIDLLIADHRAISGLLSAAHTSAAKKGWFCEIAQALVVHEVAEEEIVYPVLWRLGGTSDMADVRLAEQHAVEHRLLTMERLDPNSVDFARALATLQRVVAEHAAKEEQETFRLLRAQLDEDELFMLGTMYQDAKAGAPAHLLVLGSIARLIEEVRQGVRVANQAAMAGAR